MVPPPANLRRRFLSWDRPLPAQAAALLADDWSGTGPLDVSTVLAIVPTRQSGRRLREALAAHAASRGAAVFPPRMMLPESLLSPADSEGVATRLESLLAWARVFRSIDLNAFRAVFPVDPPVRNLGWALRLARQFIRLQRALAESGLRLGDVISRVGVDFPERDRWRELGALEQRLDEALSAVRRRDAPAARIAQARAPVLPEGIRRIVVLAAPDPQPLALTALAELSRRVPVEIVIHAPEGEAAVFDDWGRPLPEVWNTRILELPQFERMVHGCADPAAEAARVAELAVGYGRPEGLLGVGVADPDVRPLLEHALAQADLAAFNPEGRPRRDDSLYPLLESLARLAQESSFGTVEALARFPDVLAFLETRLGASFSAARFLRALDQLKLRHLPPTLAEAERQASRRNETAPGDHLPAALAVFAELRTRLQSGTFPQNVVEVLTDIFGARRYDLARPEDAAAVEAAETWTGILRDIAGAVAAGTRLKAAEWWEVALQLYAESVRYADKPEGAVELHGWLELLWEDAPHLVIAGLNDGRVPEAIVGDPFLPESLRVALGLKTNAARFARDAYLLQAVAAGRDGTGEARLDLLFAKASVTGDPLRPSRLLLRCADGDLPARIAFLFHPAADGRAAPPWRRAWRLVPRVEAPPARVAVTGFRAWLECPFRFYLARLLRLESVDAGKTELDVFDFGTLCHAALEGLGSEPAMRNETNPAVLREFLLGRLEAAAARRFGAELTLPLLVQLESARQRLARAAEVQAVTRTEGWVIEAVERPFELEVAGLVVTGKIDRLDRHEQTGAVRVIDYKTSDRPVTPLQAHVRRRRRDETTPEFARFVAAGREHVWSDLQLPLYLRAVAAGAKGAQVELAYFNLPKAAGETGLAPWTGYTPELDAAAWRCAGGIASAIRAGGFWPPGEQIAPERDEFGALFHHGAADSIDWRGAVAAEEAAP